MQTITVTTTFDITNTNIIRRYNKILLTASITNEDEYNTAKKQQTNFETIMQVISLRTQPTIIHKPKTYIKNKKKYWAFDFTVEFDNVYYDGKDNIGLLKSDCNNTPMINKLTSKISDNYLQVNKNIFLEVDTYEL